VNGNSTHVIDFVNVDGGPSSGENTGNFEATADIEWAGAMAPGATLKVYSAPNTKTENVLVDATDVYNAVANDDNAQVFSISNGAYETDIDAYDSGDDEYDTFIYIAESAFWQMETQGQSAVSGTGDYGSSPTDGVSDCCNDDARYPGSSGAVLAVGGTVVTLNGSNDITGEVVWNTGPYLNTDDGCASGGAQSQLVGAEGWQDVSGVPAAASDERITSDLALNADDYYVYQGGDTSGEGVSFGVPQIAAMIAVVISQESGTSLGLPNTSIYTIASGSDYSSDFNDITSGNNCAELITSETQTCTSSTFPAGTGWDYPSGWGTPNISNLIADIKATAY
jgi:kumamolisin